MSEDVAWNKFYTTGRVVDYLIYATIKNLQNDKLKGAKPYANSHRRIDNKRKVGF